MSKWEQLRKGDKASCFCPGCKGEMLFAELLQCPELLKCKKCGAEFLLIKLPSQKEKVKEDD